MLSSVSKNAWDSLPSLPKFQIDSTENMMKKASVLAIPAILLLGSQAIQGADALGCIGCGICLIGGGSLACVPICVVCGVTIPAPLG